MSDVSINKEEFEGIGDTNLKLNILFKAVIDNTQMLKKHVEAIELRFEMGNERFKKLENRKRLNTAASFGGGVVGGIIAIVAKNLFGVGK